jgi:poly-gamma-glutamate synthesis protein (capsule biosynthesis protein)
MGDLMCLSEQQRHARTPDGSFNFNSSFECVRKLLAVSDFSMGTLETILNPAHPYKSEATKVDDGMGYMVPNCNAPVTFLDALRYAGIDAVSTANNHALDSGIRGLLTTKEHLDRYNILHTGTYRDKNEPRCLLVDVNGIRVAVLAHTTYLNNMEITWKLTPQEKALHTNHYVVGESETIVADEIRSARANGADYVIMMLHSGFVNTLSPSGKVKRVCCEIANAGADYIINAHSHTLQRYSFIRTHDGRRVPVIYSIGNFVHSMDQAEDKKNRDAIILTLELEKREDGSIKMRDGYIPCFSRRNHNGNRYVTLPCDRRYNGGFKAEDLSEAKKRIKESLGEKIKKISSKKYEL